MYNMGQIFWILKNVWEYLLNFGRIKGINKSHIEIIYN